MRVLFTFVGGVGHAVPMVPIARALVAAGHTVAFTGSPTPLVTLAAMGFETLSLDGSSAGAADAADTATPTVQPLVEPSQQHEEDVVRNYYATRLPRRRAPIYQDIFTRWRPDVVVRDEMDFASSLVAEALGVPRAVVIVIAAGGFARPDVVAEPLDLLRREYGLPSDPTLQALARDLVLSPCPPRFRDPADPLPATARYFGPDESAPQAAEVPGWLTDLNDRPLVYVTLGTVFPLESGDLFQRLLAGLAELPVNVVATVGRELDPAVLGPQPPHVHVERWLPHDAVIDRASLVVSHGGSGTVLAALAHGLPQIVLAMGADQLLNAQRVDALGVGRSLHPIVSTPAMVRDTASELMTDLGVRAAAADLQREIAALPKARAAVPLLEDLADRPGTPRQQWSYPATQ